MTYTHTPFKIVGRSENDGEAFIIENADRTACWTTCSYDLAKDEDLVTQEDRELAEFIVKACNEHEKLVAVLRELIQDVESVGVREVVHGSIDWPDLVITYNKAKMLLDTEGAE